MFNSVKSLFKMMPTVFVTRLTVLFLVAQWVCGCNWQQLQRLAEGADLYSQCGQRDSEVTKKYLDIFAMEKQTHLTPDDYVRQTVFGQLGGTSQKPIYYLQDLPMSGERIRVYLRGSKDQLWLKAPVVSQGHYHIAEGQNFAMIMLNEFPYTEDEGISHLVMWFGRTWSQLQSTELSRYVLANIVSEGYESVTYSNKPDTKSVPGVGHAQVFIRARPLSAPPRHSLAQSSE